MEIGCCREELENLVKKQSRSIFVPTLEARFSGTTETSGPEVTGHFELAPQSAE